MVMEKAPLAPEESKSSPESTPAKKRRSVREVVRDWLYFREFGSVPVEEAEEESDENTEKKKKKNRFQMFFKRLFNAEVSQEPVKVTEVNERVTEAPLLSGFVDYEPTYEVKPKEELGDVLPPVISGPETAKVAPLTELEPETPEVHSNNQVNEVTVSLHDREEVATTPIHQEVKRESTNGYVSRDTLKNVDTLSRRRDKKQQREISYTKKELKKVQELQEQTAQELQEETDRARSTLSEKRIEAPFINPLPERPIQANIERPKVDQQSAPQSVKEILAKRQVESTLAPAEKRAETLAHSNYEQLKPEAVQKAVEEVSEKNIAIEGLFERRHESKDEADFAAKQSGGQGGIAAIGNQQTTAPVNPISHSQSQINKKLPSIKTLDAQYKKAALNGVWAAVILLIFLAILFVVR